MVTWLVKLEVWQSLDAFQRKEFVRHVTAMGDRFGLDLNDRPDRNPRLGDYEEYEGETLSRHCDAFGYNSPQKRQSSGGM